jgi:hypothetical protein
VKPVSSAVLIFFLTWQGTAQSVTTAYPSMVPLPRYLDAPRCGDLSRTECGPKINLR